MNPIVRIDQAVITFALSLIIWPCISSIQAANTYGETCGLLLKIENSSLKDETLARLFQIGDERVQDLIKALNDQNVVIKRNAQVIIRYLGNDDGMKALFESYKASKGYSEAGPIPLPLRLWDYERIRKNYFVGLKEWDQRATPYIYALALDGSATASNLLSELSKKIEQGFIPHHYALQRIKEIRPSARFSKEADLAKFVSENAFFIHPNDSKHTTSKLIGFNHSRDKALVKVFVDGGPLSTELYHIVLQKQGDAWIFYSVTPISVS